MRAPTAVDPDLSSPEATSGIFRSFSSSSRKPRNIPRLIPSIISSWVRLCSCCRLHVNSSEALMQSSRWWLQCADTLPPACPSNCKPGDILLLIRDPDHRTVGVLHLDPPPLHRGEAIA